MNDKKFCFIICSNRNEYLDECISYINRLIIPEDYDIDLLTIGDAVSMASGYNEAMNATDAKYKIYIHDDTFILNENILNDLLDIFNSDSKIGAVGVLGADEFLANNITNPGEVYGKVVSLNSRQERLLSKYRYMDKPVGKVEGQYAKVGTVYGMFIATCVDIEWEDLFERDFTYYSEIYSFLLKEKGYKLVVSNQKTPWVAHLGNSDGNSHTKEQIAQFTERFGNMIDKRTGKRILFLVTKKVSFPTLAYEMYRMGYYVEIYFEIIDDSIRDEATAKRLADWIKNNGYEYLISYEFAPDIAKAAKNNNIKYLAWAWDSPLLMHYFEEAKYDTSYIYTFDKEELNNIKRAGVKNAFYLPLTTDVFLSSGTVINREDEQRFRCDISFIGNMYDDYMIKNPELYFEDDMIDIVKEYFTDKNCKWDKNVEYVNEYTEKLFKSYCKMVNAEQVNETDEFKRAFFEQQFARNIAHAERVKILNKIADNYPIDLYTRDGEISELKGVNIHGPVDQMTEMPKVFHLSKINLNHTLHCIKTGAPLRIFDIMGVGGFVLSNYQEELPELFKVDNEIVLYRDLDEMMDKIVFYLKHDELRSKIAMSGYKKVKKRYTHELAINKMLAYANKSDM